jgi:hypothetical protein
MIIVQIIAGATARIFQFMGLASSAVIYRISTVHKYLGYALIIVGKVQAYLMLYKIYYESDSSLFLEPCPF